jgi:hypothetical protein
VRVRVRVRVRVNFMGLEFLVMSDMHANPHIPETTLTLTLTLTAFLLRALFLVLALEKCTQHV